MKYLLLFFIATKIFYFFNARLVHRVQQQLAYYVKLSRKKHEGLGLFVTHSQFHLLIGFLLADLALLFYSLHLMQDLSTWNEGCLLLLIDVLQTSSTHFFIKGAYKLDEFGFAYPAMWLRYLCFGMSMYILLNLYEHM